VEGGGSVCPEALLDYVPEGWVGESHMISIAHLFVLQIHASSFGTGQWGEMAQNREAFCRLGFQYVTEFDSDWCSVFCLLGGKKEKKKRERNSQGAFFPEWDMPCWLCYIYLSSVYLFFFEWFLLSIIVFLFFIFLILLFTCAYNCLGHFSPLPSSSTLFPLSSRQSCSAFITSFVEEKRQT
jgi:hypothetical protein